MLRKYMFIFLIFILAGSTIISHASASEKIKVFTNGTELNFNDVDPRIENNRTLVPLRKIFESLGATVSYDGTTQTVFAIKENTEMTLVIGSKYPIVNSEKVEIDVPAKVIDGRTLVPLRFVSEALGAQVNWNATTKTITIQSNSPEDMQPSIINIY